MSITEMMVHMDCPGCEAKIRKALQKLDGVDDVDVDMTLQKVTVMGWADQRKVLKAVRKTGRKAELWPYPYNPEYYDFNQQYSYLYQQQRQPRKQRKRHKSQPVITYYATQSSRTRNSSSYYDSNNYANSSSYYDSNNYANSSSYYGYDNYGYSDDDGDDYGYYHQPAYSTMVDQPASSMFSDENPHSCSIM